MNAKDIKSFFAKRKSPCAALAQAYREIFYDVLNIIFILKFYATVSYTIVQQRNFSSGSAWSVTNSTVPMYSPDLSYIA